jgi:eukaryotic-like serine/threonine-protein kinase
MRVDLQVNIDDEGSGIGFLFGLQSLNQAIEKQSCYILWLPSKRAEKVKLPKNAIVASKTPLKANISYNIAIEKLASNIHLFIDGKLSHVEKFNIGLHGPYMGVLFENPGHVKGDIFFYEVPSAFQESFLAPAYVDFASGQFREALEKFRNVSLARPHEKEGIRGLFYAGLTLLEEAKLMKSAEKRTVLCQEALIEFGKLQGTAGAPLEFLGRALLFKFLQDPDKELESFEEIFARFPHHPLLGNIKEQLLIRLTEQAKDSPKIASRFALLAILFIPAKEFIEPAQEAIQALLKGLEVPFFIDRDQEAAWSAQDALFSSALQLSFWLKQPLVIIEIFNRLDKQNPVTLPLQENALFALMELGEWQLAQKKLDQLFSTSQDVQAFARFQLIQKIINIHRQEVLSLEMLMLSELPYELEFYHLRFIRHILQFAQSQNSHSLIEQILDHLNKKKLSSKQKSLLKPFQYS